MIAGVGLMAVGVGMDLMASALEDLDVGKILGLAFTFAIMGAMIPMILLGAFAMGIMASAMIPLAVAEPQLLELVCICLHRHLKYLRIRCLK